MRRNFPLRQRGLDLSVKNTTAVWDQLAGGSGLDHLDADLVRQIRVWHPEVVVLSDVRRPGRPRATAFAARDLESDRPCGRSALRDRAARRGRTGGELPCQVKRVYATAPPGQASGRDDRQRPACAAIGPVAGRGHLAGARRVVRPIQRGPRGRRLSAAAIARFAERRGRRPAGRSRSAARRRCAAGACRAERRRAGNFAAPPRSAATCKRFSAIRPIPAIVGSPRSARSPPGSMNPAPAKSSFNWVGNRIAPGNGRPPPRPSSFWPRNIRGIR